MLGSIGSDAEACAVPDSWNGKIYRQRAEAWRQKAVLLPEGHEEATLCREIADGYAKLARALEAKGNVARKSDEPAEIVRASHVMELVRGNSALSHLVLRLRESGLSWREVRAAIEAEINRLARR